mgnify:CR=1 FL=1|tara:strand:+ start:997 stop:1293 length:297 start_codon:yes stop_codon:yes gene_type:complete
MFVRIVKLTLKKENIASFEQIFEESKNVIRNVEGCTFLELLQDKNNPNIFFTYSFWQSEEHLDKYRNSDYFKNIWSETKKLFADRAEAWSVDKKITLN